MLKNKHKTVLFCVTQCLKFHKKASDVLFFSLCTHNCSFDVSMLINMQCFMADLQHCCMSVFCSKGNSFAGILVMQGV